MSNWIYLAVVLDDESREKLREKFSNVIPTTWKTDCDHVTLVYNDGSDEALSFAERISPLLGRRVELLVTHIGFQFGVGALKVTLPEGVPCRGSAPHITLGHSLDSSSKMSNNIGEESWNELQQPEILSGIIEVFPRQ